MTMPHYDFSVENQSKRKMSAEAGERFAAEVRRLLRQSGLTQTQLAESLNTSQGTVSRWLSGKQSPSVEHWQIVQKALAGSAVVNHEPHSIPLSGYIALEGEVHLVEGESTSEMVVPTVTLPPGIKCLTVRGNNLYPRYHDGEIVFYSDEHFPPADMLNRECVCKVKGGRTYLKVIRRGSQPHLFTLVGYASPEMDDVELEWATPIRFVQRF